MLRLETETGWWLVTHPDHARLAGAVAEHWGNDLFAPPEPRQHVLLGIHAHDDGWAVRDAKPSVTKQGKPAAFSVELVGKYSAFEEIDLQDYLNVRERAGSGDCGEERLCGAVGIEAYVQPLNRSCGSIDDRSGANAAARCVSGSAAAVAGGAVREDPRRRFVRGGGCDGRED